MHLFYDDDQQQHCQCYDLWAKSLGCSTGEHLTSCLQIFEDIFIHVLRILDKLIRRNTSHLGSNHRFPARLSNKYVTFDASGGTHSSGCWLYLPKLSLNRYHVINELTEAKMNYNLLKKQTPFSVAFSKYRASAQYV